MAWRLPTAFAMWPAPSASGALPGALPNSTCRRPQAAARRGRAERRRCSVNTSVHIDSLTEGQTDVIENGSPSTEELTTLQKAIKAVAVGKHGSRPIPEDLVDSIIESLAELATKDGSRAIVKEADRTEAKLSDEEGGEDDMWAEEAFVSPETYQALLHRASFLGSLFVKSTLLPHERRILEHVGSLARIQGAYAQEEEDMYVQERGCRPEDVLAVACPYLAPDTELYEVATDLLKGRELDKNKARAVGNVLFAMPAPLLYDGVEEPSSAGDPAETDSLSSFRSADVADPAEDVLTSLQDDEGDDLFSSVDEDFEHAQPGVDDDTNQDNSLDPVRVLIAHIMRVRHETSSELCGLQEATMDAISAPFVEDYDGNILVGRLRIAHVADPFDGVQRSYLITPLIARHLQNRWGYNASVMSAGRSSGPKLPPRAVNVRDLLESGLDARLISEQTKYHRTLYSRGKPIPRPCGYVVDQSLCAPGLDRWVEIRRTIIKRPALAIIEKYLDTTRNAGLFVLSAFHGSVVEKMLDVAENMQIPATIVICKGLEGSLSMPTHRRGFGVLSCSLFKKKTGRYLRREFTVTAEEALMPYPAEEEKLKLTAQELSPERNVELIEAYIETGCSGDPSFDKQVRATMYALDKALKWIHFNSDIVGWQRWTKLHGVRGLT